MSQAISSKQTGLAQANTNSSRGSAPSGGKRFDRLGAAALRLPAGLPFHLAAPHQRHDRRGCAGGAATAAARAPDPSELPFLCEPSGQQALQAGNATQLLPRSLLNSAIIAFMVVTMNLLVGVRRLRLLAVPLQRQRRHPDALPGLADGAGGSDHDSDLRLLRRVQLLDTLFALAIADLTLTLPFTIWILKSYFQTIPQELEDAARVDRCSRFQAIVRVLLPVSTPGCWRRRCSPS